MNEEEIKIYPIKTCKDYGPAKRNVEELNKKISLLRLSLNLTHDETSKLETEIAVLNQKLNEQQAYISKFIKAQANYNSKFLSKNLDYLLKMQGLRISDLEELLGVSAGYVSRTINPDSKKRLSVDIVWKIAMIFQVNIDELLNIDFQIPTQPLCEVITFFEKLKQETDETIVHWKNQGNKIKDHIGLFFKELEECKPDGTKQYKYAPDRYANETKAVGLTDDIYSSEINIGELYLLPLENQFGEKGYELYIYTVASYELNLICSTFDDRSNTLKSKCDELFKSVKLHESDFVISESAKSLISKYLNPKNNDSMNSGDDFINIPDEFPFN